MNRITVLNRIVAISLSLSVAWTSTTWAEAFPQALGTAWSPTACSSSFGRQALAESLVDFPFRPIRTARVTARIFRILGFAAMAVSAHASTLNGIDKASSSSAGKLGIVFVASSFVLRLLHKIRHSPQKPSGFFAPLLKNTLAVGQLSGRQAGREPSVDGPSLDFVIRAWNDHRTPPTERLPYIVVMADQLLQALDLLHGKEFGHNDIRPINIHLSADHAVLADSGSATPFGQRTSLARGYTPKMGAPENSGQTRDVYALGATLAEALINNSKFKNLIHDDKIAPTFKSQNPEAVGLLVDVIQKATQINPGDRYQSAAEMRSDILTIKDKLSASKNPPAFPQDQSQNKQVPPNPLKEAVTRSA